MNPNWEAKDKEGDKKTTTTNELIHYGDRKTIFSVGGFGMEGWAFGNICEGAIENGYSGLDKPHYITFPSGAYMVVKTRAISEVGPQGPFVDETFLYLDDCLLGLILWNRGYRVTYVPVKAGLHYAGMTTK